MSIIRDKIEEHLRRNEKIRETQAGFTKGGRIEDSLFILQYMVEENYRKIKTLVVMSLDYSKAYDLIRREEIVKALKQYNIHPEIIQALVNIYNEDRMRIELSKSIQEEMEVTSGIRQGCTGSTLLFKLITYCT